MVSVFLPANVWVWGCTDTLLIDTCNLFWVFTGVLFAIWRHILPNLPCNYRQRRREASEKAGNAAHHPLKNATRNGQISGVFPVLVQPTWYANFHSFFCLPGTPGIYLFNRSQSEPDSLISFRGFPFHFYPPGQLFCTCTHPTRKLNICYMLA